MRKVKLTIIEIVAALGLLGLAYIYVHIRHDPGIVSPGYVKAILLIVYAIVAASAQALTASELQVMGPPLLFFNLVVAAVLSLLWWSRDESWEPVAALAVITVVFRLFVASISFRTSPKTVRQAVSCATGTLSFFFGLGLAYVFGDYLYENYFLLPRIKQGFIVPERWQDFAFLVLVLVGSVSLVFLSYRLLKYTFQRRPAPTSAAS